MKSKLAKTITVIAMILHFIVAIFVVLTILSGCRSDASIASRNISTEADQFRVRRRIVFINLRHDSYLFKITGCCSISTNENTQELQVTCRVGEDKYQKHFLRLTDEVTYTVEQIDYSEVSKYDYEIIFKPASIIPIDVKVE